MSLGQMCLVIILAIAAIQTQAQPKKLSGQAKANKTLQRSLPAGTVDCKSLMAELKAMQQAQKTLLTNMVQNNETMASTLDQYAGEFKQTRQKRKVLSSKDITSLKQSAEAFRQHKSREQNLVARFDAASERALSKVESCLKR